MSNKNTSLRLQRANFVVTSLEQSLKFYQEVLGFSLDFVKDSPDVSYSYDVFEIERNQSIRFAVLSTNSQARALALTELAGAELAPVPMPRRAAIVLDVADVDAVVAGAKALDCHVYEEEELITHDGRVGREVGIVDFDGNLVVIYHIPATGE